MFFSSPSTHYQLNGYGQGTSYHISYYAADSLVGTSDIGNILDMVDSSMSLYKPYSLINRFNASSEGILMDRHMEAVVARGIEVCKATGGQFEITVQPLVEAWGFGVVKPENPPDSATIRALLPCTGSSKLKIKNHFLRKTQSCVKIDLNGIAQGYTVDLIAAHFDAKNIHDYIVELGGEIRISGKKPGGQPFQIGIESPEDDEFIPRPIRKILVVPSGGVTSSGNYQKFYESKGKKISHLINPKTGFPLDNELISVTVWSKDAMTSDAYDNALMGMGMKKGLEFVKKKKGIEAYFIFRGADGKVRDTASAGFNSKLQKQ
ncbi:MAG: FAD:protein FMN transferase [Gemmatimonadaceae bacterium]|nr:FAD:protein FMN transferase [Chitinophagaceae bacterium]